MKADEFNLRIEHPIPPFIQADSRVLILGSFPSVMSRRTGFYYGHKSNRFWHVLAALLEKEVPCLIEDKTALLRFSHIAIWDVIASCVIKGSADSSIRDARVNPIAGQIAQTQISALVMNGGTAAKLYQTYVLPKPSLPVLELPSTSAANASFSIQALIEKWQAILPYLK